jgi:hypothetical protein
MKKILLKWTLSITLWVIDKLLDKSEPLTPEILAKEGWTKKLSSSKEGNFWYWCKPNVRIRDRIAVVFDTLGYRVYHGGEFCFIAHRDSKAWLDIYVYIMSKSDK